MRVELQSLMELVEPFRPLAHAQKRYAIVRSDAGVAWIQLGRIAVLSKPPRRSPDFSRAAPSLLICTALSLF